MPETRLLDDQQVQHVSSTILKLSRHPLRDDLMLRLSVYAGLAAREIASLEISDVIDDEGKVDTSLRITAGLKEARTVPLAPELRQAIARYVEGRVGSVEALLLTQYDAPMTANAVQKQLGRIYRSAGLVGATSHSGRRTFIVRALSRAKAANCSIEDVQLLVGHANIRSTMHYSHFAKLTSADKATRVSIGIFASVSEADRSITRQSA